jgi:hypothetical protein
MHRIIVAGILAALILGGIWWFGTSMSNVAASSAQNDCKNKILGTLPAPDGALQAIAFRRDCGPSGISSHVSIVKKGGSLGQGAGNIFRASTPPGRPQQPWIHLQWATNKSVVIGFDSAAQIFKTENDYDGATIHYEGALFPPNTQQGLLVNAEG